MHGLPRSRKTLECMLLGSMMPISDHYLSALGVMEGLRRGELRHWKRDGESKEGTIKIGVRDKATQMMEETNNGKEIEREPLPLFAKSMRFLRSMHTKIRS